MPAYATAAQLMKRYDVRILGQLVSDNGVQVGKSDLGANENLLTALADASGEIDASVLQASRYTVAQLAALTGNSANYLIRLTCTIAYGLLWERRSTLLELDEDAGDTAQKRARQALEQLRKGQQIFDIEEVKQAGLPAISTPSITRIQSLNLAVDQARGHYYPNRRLPRR